MSKKNNHNRYAKPAAKSITQVRNTSIPKVARPAQPIGRREITREMIAVRAYEISQSPACGSETDNWLRAERELRGV
jgi:hypothetical protein